MGVAHDHDLPRTASAVTTTALRDGARRRLVAAALVLPVGALVTVAVVAVSMPGAARLRPVVAAVGVALQVLLVVPRGLRIVRLWRAGRRERRGTGAADPVLVAVYPSAPLSALDAVVAVWAADDPEGPPVRVHAGDRSTRPMVDGGRTWATVVGGPAPWATYRLDDGTPVVGAGRTNLLQRWVTRGRVRDLRRRGWPLDRRIDAPYPRVEVPGRLGREVVRALWPALGVVLLVVLFGLLVSAAGRAPLLIR